MATEIFINVTTECEDPLSIGNFHVARPNAVAGLVVPILGWIYVLSGIIFYFYSWKQNITLRTRNSGLTIISICGIAWTFSVPLGNFITYHRIPCALWTSYHIIMFLVGFWPVAVRAILFYNRISFSRLLAEKTFADYLENPYLKDVFDAGNIRSRHGSQAVNQIRHFSRKNKTVHSPSELSGKSVTSVEGKESVEIPFYVKLAKFKASSLFGYMLVALPCALYSIYFCVLVQPKYHGCSVLSRPCRSSRPEWAATFGIGALIVGVLTWALWKVRNEPDPLYIAREIKEIFYILFGVIFVWLMLNSFDPAGIQSRGIFLYWILVIPGLCLAITRMLYPAYEVITKSFDDKDDDNAIKSLSHLLESEIGRQLFKAHMVHELNIENYYFWREATEWRASFEVQPEEDRLRRFRFLVETFIASDSLMKVNLNSSQNNSILKVLEGQRPLTAKVFDDAIRSIFILMAFDSLSRFKQTDLYKKQYLHSELATEMANGLEDNVI